MKVMICGGAKTRNIKNALEDRFKHGEITMVVMNNMTEFESLLNRGEYIDRAVVFEQGITQDGKVTDEYDIRDRVSEFVNVFESQLSKEATLIFVVRTDDMAKIVAEESMEIGRQCRILVKQPQYTIAFMARLVSFNIELIEPELVYKLVTEEAEVDEDSQVIYSKYEDSADSGEELKTVREIQFEGLGDIKADEPKEEAYDGREVSNFDDELFGNVSDNSMSDFEDMEDDFKSSDVNEEDTYDKEDYIEEPMSGTDEEDIDLESLFGNDNIPEENDEIHDKKSNNTDIYEENLDGVSDRGYNMPYDNQEADLSQHGILDINEVKNNRGINFDKEVEDMKDDKENNTTNLWDEDDEAGIDSEPEYGEPMNFGGTVVEENEGGIASLFDDDDFNFGDESTQIEHKQVKDGLRITDEDEMDDNESVEDPFSINDDEFEEMHKREEKSIQNISSLFEQEDDTMYEEDSLRDSEIDIEKAEEMLMLDERDNSSNTKSDEDELYSDHLEMRQDKFENEQDQFIGGGPGPNLEKQGISIGKRGKKGNKNLPMSMETPISRKAEEDLRKMLSTFRNKGTSIVITGTNCSGKSVTAYNLANLITRLGFTALVVDMDTVNRAQAYINSDAYDAIHSLDPENPSLKQALNSTSMGISKYASIVRPGFHILTMGLAGDIVKGEKLAPRQKLARFGSNVRNNYNVVIYDMPFDVATDYAEDITFTADHIMITCEASNHGLMNLMLAMCNIEKEDMQETMFAHSQLCLTKYIELKKVFGQDVKNVRQGLLRIDREVQDLLGVDPEFYFSSIPVCGIMKFNNEYERTWFSKEAYSDTREGRAEYVELLTKMFSR